MARARIPWELLLVLGGSLAAWLYFRSRPNGAVDTLELVSVTAKKIGGQISATITGWLAKVPPVLEPLFASATRAYGLPRRLLEAVGYRESRFRPEIISGALPSSAGAIGVMQIVPKWHPSIGEAGARDPARAIPYAAKYLRELYGQFGTWPLALAAYNWGPGNLQKHLAAGKGPELWPAETRTYVAEIIANAGAS
jgi:soluble lytic murein transglycosylase-like protein